MKLVHENLVGKCYLFLSQKRTKEETTEKLPKIGWDMSQSSQMLHRFCCLAFKLIETRDDGRRHRMKESPYCPAPFKRGGFGGGFESTGDILGTGGDWLDSRAFRGHGINEVKRVVPKLPPGSRAKRGAALSMVPSFLVETNQLLMKERKSISKRWTPK